MNFVCLNVILMLFEVDKSSGGASDTSTRNVLLSDSNLCTEILARQISQMDM